jgi:muramoyltetrapeptide carboxypeptidase
MGTRWEIEADGHILFIEEVREAPYRVDRMLSTLRLAGKLDNLAGAVIGQCHRCDAEAGDNSFTISELVAQYFGGRPYPVIVNFPVGHVNNNATIPIGAMAEVDGDAGTLRLLENPVRLR